jgi:hypothetical protein
MNIGDQVKVPDGRIGTLIRLENGVATVVFVVLNHVIQTAFNQSDVQPAP